jgi:hypothetical protein
MVTGKVHNKEKEKEKNKTTPQDRSEGHRRRGDRQALKRAWQHTGGSRYTE